MSGKGKGKGKGNANLSADPDSITTVQENGIGTGNAYPSGDAIPTIPSNGKGKGKGKGTGNKYGEYRPLVVSYRALAKQFVKTLKRRSVLQNENSDLEAQLMGLSETDKIKLKYIKAFLNSKVSSKEELLSLYKYCRDLFYKYKCLEENNYFTPDKNSFIQSGASRNDIYKHRHEIEILYDKAFVPIKFYLILKNELSFLANPNSQMVKPGDKIHQALTDFLKPVEPRTKITSQTESERVNIAANETLRTFSKVLVVTKNNTADFDPIVEGSDEVKLHPVVGPVKIGSYKPPKPGELQIYDNSPKTFKCTYSKIFNSDPDTNSRNAMSCVDGKFEKDLLTVISLGRSDKFDLTLHMVIELAKKKPNRYFTAVQLYIHSNAKLQLQENLHDMNADGNISFSLVAGRSSVSFTPLKESVSASSSESGCAIPVFKLLSEINKAVLDAQRIKRHGRSKSVVFITLYDESKIPFMSCVDLPGNEREFDGPVEQEENRGISSILEFFKFLCFTKQNRTTLESKQHMDSPITQAIVASSVLLQQLKTSYSSFDHASTQLKLNCSYTLGIFNQPESNVVLLVNSSASTKLTSKDSRQNETKQDLDVTSSLETLEWAKSLYHTQPKKPCSDFEAEITGGSKSRKFPKIRRTVKKILSM